MCFTKIDQFAHHLMIKLAIEMVAMVEMFLFSSVAMF